MVLKLRNIVILFGRNKDIICYMKKFPNNEINNNLYKYY